LSYETIKEHGRVVISFSYAISRSNAIDLWVLVKHYDLTFLDAQKLIKQKVEKSDIVQAHIDKLQKLLIK
jgi:hypothetical protein